MEDAAHSLRLALEREQAGIALQEATALRRSQELQRDFLSRLSHELRTPLTAIRGYATSLLQPDVTWDAESQQRFLHTIAAESNRLGRLVDDLLDFSVIELGILRLQPDWCDIGLVLEAAAACLPPDGAAMVELSCAPDLPVVWADHDRLEQVFVNLLGNAVGHNPPGTRGAGAGRVGRPRVGRDHGHRRGRRPARGDGGRAVRAASRAGPDQDGGRGARPVDRARYRDRPRRAAGGPAVAAGASFLVRLPVEDGTRPLGGDGAYADAGPSAAEPRQPVREGGGRRWPSRSLGRERSWSRTTRTSST